MIRRIVFFFFLAWALRPVLQAAASWQEITLPSVAELASAWPKPPAEYGAIHWAIWGGEQTKERILTTIERVSANGGSVYMINNSRGLRPKYFSPEYLELVKFTVAECKKHGLKLWIEDDAGYPDGMAGGAISRDYPQLGMQGIVADARYQVAAGQTLKIPLPPDTLGILAYNRSTRTSTVLPLPKDGNVVWTAPNPGASELVFVRHVYRSSPTRYTNRDDNTSEKDSLYSLIDYLDPVATQTYLRLIHETYARLVGDEFGKTILGFRGDEPDYSGFMPWTPKLLEEFQRQKGYELQPYIAQFFAVELSSEVVRAKADYWDVWSRLFRDNFFKPQSEWCRARGMEYMVHLNHEETMLDLARGEDLIRNEGSLFRAMRYADVPGIDNLNQIGPGIVADFPKLAADLAHVYGRPHVWSEEGGAPGQAGKFVADYQLVRGVNYLNLRGLSAAEVTTPPQLLNAPATLAAYVGRAGYALAVGRPAAQIALFHPTDSLWLGDQEADTVTVKLTTELLEHQLDFDALDSEALSSICRVEGNGLKNLSGQVYRAVIVPTCTAIGQNVLERLRVFAKSGGTVIFIGRTPTLVYEKSFLRAGADAPDLSFATLLEPTAEITARVIAALPADLTLNSPYPLFKYIHRSLKDGELYFFFNESGETVTRTAKLLGRGVGQIWDATTGKIHALADQATADARTDISFTLAPYETRFVVVGPLPPGAANPFPSSPGEPAESAQELGGKWSVTLGEKNFDTVLLPWQELGIDTYEGVADYRKTFPAPVGAPAGKRVYLDLGDVRAAAKVRINDTEFPPRGWPPYLWDVTGALHSGDNAIVVQVQVPAFTGRAFGAFEGSGRAQRGSAPSDTPKIVAPTGVPGGLATDASIVGGRRRANEMPSASLPVPGATGATTVRSGLLGPVQLLVY